MDACHHLIFMRLVEMSKNTWMTDLYLGILEPRTWMSPSKRMRGIFRLQTWIGVTRNRIKKTSFVKKFSISLPVGRWGLIRSHNGIDLDGFGILRAKQNGC